MIQKSNIILLEEVLWQVGGVIYSVVLLKDPVIAAQTRNFSQDGCPLQNLHTASHCLMPLHNLNVFCSLSPSLMVIGLHSASAMALILVKDPQAQRW